MRMGVIEEPMHSCVACGITGRFENPRCATSTSELLLPLTLCFHPASL